MVSFCDVRVEVGVASITTDRKSEKELDGDADIFSELQEVQKEAKKRKERLGISYTWQNVSAVRRVYQHPALQPATIGNVIWNGQAICCISTELRILKCFSNSD